MDIGKLQQEIEKAREEVIKLLDNLPDGEINPCSATYIKKINEIEDVLDKVFSKMGFKRIQCPVTVNLGNMEEYLTVYKGVHPIGVILVVMHPFVENKCRLYESRKALIAILADSNSVLSIGIIGKDTKEEERIAHRLGFDVPSENTRSTIQEREEKKEAPITHLTYI